MNLPTNVQTTIPLQNQGGSEPRQCSELNFGEYVLRMSIHYVPSVEVCHQAVTFKDSDAVQLSQKELTCAQKIKELTPTQY